MAVSRLLYEAGSPEMAFKLSESALCDAIERIAQRNEQINLSDVAGLSQFSFTADPQILAAQILQDYYSEVMVMAQTLSPGRRVRR